LSCLPLGFGPTGAASPDPEPLAVSLGPMGPPPAPAPAGTLHGPATPGNGAPFLFVSYARADGDRVYPVIEELIQHGASVWIDRRIVGGDDWVVELETRILHCTGILAFVSRSFVASKYCGRELRFGDALNKTIIPVFLEPAELSGGLNFILHAIQRVMLADNADLAPVISAVQMQAPAAWCPPRA
jgi:hypothetical protein